MGHVLHSLPEGNAVWGMTSLDNRLYVLRNKTSQQIEVYDTQSYRLLQRMTVPLLSTMNDIVSCAHNRCLYIADAKASTCVNESRAMAGRTARCRRTFRYVSKCTAASLGPPCHSTVLVVNKNVGKQFQL